MIPEIIKQKIEDEINVRYPEFTMTEQEINFRNGAEYGYSIAQEVYDKLYADFKQVCEYDENLREENKRYRNAYNEAQEEIERLKGLIAEMSKEYNELLEQSQVWKDESGN